MSDERDRPLTSDQLLHFVELDEFTADWKRLGLDIEVDLLALQVELMRNPQAGNVVPGAGGLKKLRFSPPRWRAGKRGAIRVAYAYFPRHWTMLLVMAYAKNRKANLTAAEKQGVRTSLERIETWLDQRQSQSGE